MRELLGGLYFGQPRWWDKETGRPTTPWSTRRTKSCALRSIAFELAQKRRKKLTSVDKANVLECSQLWRAAVDEVAKDYPGLSRWSTSLSTPWRST